MINFGCQSCPLIRSFYHITLYTQHNQQWAGEKSSGNRQSYVPQRNCGQVDIVKIAQLDNLSSCYQILIDYIELR